MSVLRFLDLTDQPEAALEAAAEVASSGRYLPGEHTAAFEDAWADCCGTKFCAAVGGGGVALRLAIRALEPPLGARVVVPALTFAATAMAAIEERCIPIYVDVDERGLMCRKGLEQLLEGHKIWAVIYVHLYGQYDHFLTDCVCRLAKKHNAFLIEDACQAHGAFERLLGHAACFSFYPSKNLGAFGQAGAVVMNDLSMYERVKALSEYGATSKHDHQYVGGNYQIDEIQAAVLLAKLRFLADNMYRRLLVADAYHECGVRSIATAFLMNWHLYPVLTGDFSPEEVRSRLLTEHGIETGQHYPHILPEEPALQFPRQVTGVEQGWWPTATRIAHGHITLPMGPHLSEDDAAYVAEKFLEVTGGN